MGTLIAIEFIGVEDVSEFSNSHHANEGDRECGEGKSQASVFDLFGHLSCPIDRQERIGFEAHAI